jgi:rhamnogalacturonyl hydrolase YesR
MNWRYLLIVFILAGLVGGGSFWLTEKEDFSIVSRFIFKKEAEEEKEFVGDILVIKELDKDLVRQKIEDGKEFLLRMEHPEEHGFYKKYDAPTDTLEKRLHTVYTASAVFTFLRIYDFDKDERILEKIPGWADFLLYMQSKEEESFGAFHYSYYYEDREKEPRFVVGTSALTIFTLLDLYERFGDEKYIQSAKMAGDWLLTMQKEDNGIMTPFMEKKGDGWSFGTKESLLYNGQTLSSFSRLYRATQEVKYYEAAKKIAEHFRERVENEGCYLGDDYRLKNPISSVWVVMALYDFYRADGGEDYKNIVFDCSRELLERQRTNTDDPLYYGVWDRAYSTSGNGWLAEVMMEIYKFCQKEGKNDCRDYKTAVLRAMRWIIQNTYSEENSFNLKNPEKAIGGIFWNDKNKYVRVDSNCHALNAYIGIFDYLTEGILVSLPRPDKIEE